MKITKYEHACISIEKDGKLLVIDPGAFTTDLPALESVVAIVITHEHADHFDVNALGALIGRNPEAMIYAHGDITRQFGDTLPHTAVQAGEAITVGPFNLAFYGGNHAPIHSDIPTPANLSVLVNDRLYHPGDSFTQPDLPIDTLAMPVVAPWMKLSEGLDFLAALQPRMAFPIHDAIASQAGKQVVDSMIGPYAQSIGTDYQRPSEPFDIDG